MQFNERVTPGLVSSKNYWQSFVTGILPVEARRFASWLGEDYDLPTQDEWQAAFKAFKKERLDPRLIDQLADRADINKRARTLLHNVDVSLKEVEFEPKGGRTVADQMLMRMGIMEYVYRDTRHNSYAGYGQTNSTFFGSFETPDKGFPQQLTIPDEGARMRHYGFRLIRRIK